MLQELKTTGDREIGSSMAVSKNMKKYALLLLFEGGLQKQSQLCKVSTEHQAPHITELLHFTHATIRINATLCRFRKAASIKS